MSIDIHTVVPTPEVTTKTNEAKEQPEEVSPELKKPVSAEAETRKEYWPVVPYPQILAAGQKNKYRTEIQEIFKHVRINIPLLDSI